MEWFYEDQKLSFFRIIILTFTIIASIKLSKCENSSNIFVLEFGVAGLLKT